MVRETGSERNRGPSPPQDWQAATSIRTSAPTGKDGANPISDPDVMPFMTRPRIGEELEFEANFAAILDDTIEQGPLLVRMLARQAFRRLLSILNGGFLAFGQPSFWSGVQAGFPKNAGNPGPSGTGRCSVLPRQFRRINPAPRARRRTDLAAPVCLEERTLMAFTPLGFSPPNFAISGQAGPRAAWGGVLNVSVFLQNTGASTITEPYSQAPGLRRPIPGTPYGNTSTADAPDSTVAVFLSRSPRSVRGAIALGTIDAPPVQQNNLEQLNATFTLPSRPPGFAGAGGKFYVFFEANSDHQVLTLNRAGNLSKPVPVKLTSGPLPELRAIALAFPAAWRRAIRSYPRSRSRILARRIRMRRDRSR